MLTRTFDVRIAVERRPLVDIRGFEIPSNRITFLFGESGIGKSLMARAIYGLLDPEEFDVTINGEPYEAYIARAETRAIRTNSFFVFQEPSTHLNPLLPLGYQLNEGSLGQAPGEPELLRALWKGSDSAHIDRLLEVYPKPHRPSGGEKQRMFLVMALKKIDMILHEGRDTSQCLFVFDEPTGSLDNHFRNLFLSLLFRRFQLRQLTILLITHDYSMISQVTQVYPTLHDSVSFQEIRRAKDGLDVREFKADRYTGWVTKQARAKQQRAQAPEGKPLLRVESGIRVFGRELKISRSPTGEGASSLEVLPGTMAYLKAPSGEGKTTLMKMIMGLARGELLRMTVCGRMLTERTPASYWRTHLWGKRITMVFQHADEALNPRSRVRDIFRGLPRSKRMTPGQIKSRLGELFDGEMSDEFLDTPVLALSGGQKQRLNLSRGLSLETEILLLDEPLNGLDFESTVKVIALLQARQQAGQGILLVSHNEEIVETMVREEDVYYLSHEEKRDKGTGL